MLVRGISGTIRVWSGPGLAGVVVPGQRGRRRCGAVADRVSVTVRVPVVAYLCYAVTPEPVGVPSPQFQV